VISGGTKSAQQQIINAVSNIQPGGSTNLFGGLERAYQILSKSINDRKSDTSNENTISHSRIFLFSDGLLNAGMTDTSTILNTVSAWKNELGLSISSFGIGYDFDRKLMTSIAEAARGDFFFIDSAESIAKVIDIGRKDAASLLGKDGILRVMTAPNVQITHMFDRGLYDTEHFNEIDIRDLRVGDTKYAIVEFMVSPQESDKAEKMKVIEWQFEYFDVVQKQKKELTGSVEVALVDVSDERLNEQTNVNEHVQVFWRVNEARMTDKEILNAFEAEDYDEVVRKRRVLLDSLDSIKGSSEYHAFSMDAESGGVAHDLFATNERIMQRMGDAKIERKIEEISRKRARKEKISAAMKEEVKKDYTAYYGYSSEASREHNEL